jgi:hypothetical protein
MSGKRIVRVEIRKKGFVQEKCEGTLKMAIAFLIALKNETEDEEKEISTRPPHFVHYMGCAYRYWRELEDGECAEDASIAHKVSQKEKETKDD